MGFGIVLLPRLKFGGYKMIDVGCILIITRRKPTYESHLSSCNPSVFNEGTQIISRIPSIFYSRHYHTEHHTPITCITWRSLLPLLASFRGCVNIRNDSAGCALEGFKFSVGVVGLTCRKEMIRVIVLGDNAPAQRKYLFNRKPEYDEKS